MFQRPKPAFARLSSSLLLLGAVFGLQGCASDPHLGRSQAASIHRVRAVIRRDLKTLTPKEANLGLLLLIKTDQSGKNPQIVEHQSGVDAYNAGSALLDRVPHPCEQNGSVFVTVYLPPAATPAGPKLEECTAIFRQLAYDRQTDSRLVALNEDLARADALISSNAASINGALDALSQRLDQNYQIDRNQDVSLTKVVKSAEFNADRLNELASLVQQFSFDMRDQNSNIQQILGNINDQVKQISVKKP